MKLKKYIILCLITSLTGGLSAQKTMTGIEVLKKDNFKILEGKRVGLITNPTGVDNSLKSTIDILFEAPNVNLVALYGPEHGVRGAYDDLNRHAPTLLLPNGYAPWQDRKSTRLNSSHRT